MATPPDPASSPARVIAAGKRLASPSPVAAKPSRASHTTGASAAASMPAHAVSPPSTSTRVRPSRSSSMIPESRPLASASAKAA